ncbi:hypothetical protein [Caballeronia sordidicola]|uniref:hypothetical protein n=1 Tax=Caballeronia sordidicola TaxID=196367 RepID=UPI0011779F52|nr:hypothetical protein [Caballeronia sordidicola]
MNLPGLYESSDSFIVRRPLNSISPRSFEATAHTVVIAMNQHDTSRASSLGSNLLLAVLIGCATVMTACPVDTPEAANTTHAENTALIPNELR